MSLAELNGLRPADGPAASHDSGRTDGSVAGDIKFAERDRFVAPEAEASVLGAMLRDPSCVPRVARSLSPKHFHSPPDRKLFEAILKLGDQVETMRLVAELRVAGLLEEVGGIGRIAELAKLEPHAVHVDEYVAIVRAAAERRIAIELSRALERAARNGTTSDFESAKRAIASGTSTASGSEGGGWQPPVSLPGTGDLPAFPMHTLPLWAREWAEAEAEALQTPRDLPALLVLGVISAVLAKKVVVWIHPGWAEPINVYITIALNSGEGKSPAFRHASLPILMFEREEAHRLAPIINEARSRQKALRVRADKLHRRIKDAEDETKRAAAEEDMQEVEQDLAELKIPVRPRFVCDDVTMEALAPLMIEQGGRMALFSSEGGPFEIMAGRYGDSTGAFELFLKAHSGDFVAVDRITRDGGVMYHPILTVLLTVQPHVIAGLAEKDGFRGRGLLARLAYSLPATRVGSRAPNPPPMPKKVADTYSRMVQNLLRIPTNLDEYGETAGHGMEVDEEARAAFFRFKGELEPHLGPGGDLEAMADWANKLPGLALRLVGLIHMADDADDIARAVARRIDIEQMHRAIEIAMYLLSHARAAFGLMAADPLVEDAKFVLTFVQRKALTTVTRRDLHRGLQNRFRKAQNLDPVIEILTKHGFIHELSAPYNPKGGQPERRFAINPLPPEVPKHVTELTEPPRAPAASLSGTGSVSSVIDSEPSGPTRTPADASSSPAENGFDHGLDAVGAMDEAGTELRSEVGRAVELPSAGADAYGSAGIPIEVLQ